MRMGAGAPMRVPRASHSHDKQERMPANRQQNIPKKDAVVSLVASHLELFPPMMHSSPMPLTVALDMAKRLHHELARHMTPEQRRDFTRIEHLISEAQAAHKKQLLHASQETAKAMAGRPEPEPSRKSFWGR